MCAILSVLCSIITVYAADDQQQNNTIDVMQPTAAPPPTAAISSSPTTITETSLKRKRSDMELRTSSMATARTIWENLLNRDVFINSIAPFLQPCDFATFAQTSKASKSAVYDWLALQFQKILQNQAFDQGQVYFCDNFIQYHGARAEAITSEYLFRERSIIKLNDCMAFPFSKISGCSILNHKTHAELFLPLVFDAAEMPWANWQYAAVAHFFKGTKFLVKNSAINSDQVLQILSAHVVCFQAQQYIPILDFINGHDGIAVTTKAEIKRYRSKFDRMRYRKLETLFVIDVPVEIYDGKAYVDLCDEPSLPPRQAVLPDSFKNIAVTCQYDGELHISHKFLANYEQLNSVDLSPLSQVKSIQDDFLWGARKLHSLNISSFFSVVSIGNEFLSWCDNIQALNLSHLTHLKQIGFDFLSDCRALHTVDLPRYSTVQDVDNNFLYGCHSLRTVDLSCFSRILFIGEGFLDDTDTKVVHTSNAKISDALADTVEPF